jgi:amine acid ABC transporter, permease protein, 3-TM region, His/Glu/Gln/Arg/opine family
MFDLAYFLGLFPQLIQYVPLTLAMAVFAMILAIIIGGGVTGFYLSSIKYLQWFARLYISLFRGIPTLVLLFILYYGLPEIFPNLKGIPALLVAIAGLGLKESAYLVEVFRAGIASVDPGQVEAGESLNIKYSKLFLHIILPQAALNALPATGNTFVSLLKETSLAFVLGVTELFADGKLLASASLKFFEVYVAVGLIYWAMIIAYTWLQHFFEELLNTPYRRNEVGTDRNRKYVSEVR